MDTQFRQLLRDLQNLIDRYNTETTAPLVTKPPATRRFGRHNPQGTLEMITEHVANYFELTVKQLTGQDKGKRGSNGLAEVRWIPFRLAREFTDLSLNQIGQFFNRDHGSVLHGMKRCESMMSIDAQYAEAVHALENDVRTILAVAESPNPIAAFESFTNGKHQVAASRPSVSSAKSAVK